MDTEIKNAVDAAGADAQYDEKAKRLLGNNIHLTKDDLLGSYQWEGGLDLLNIIMIGIEDELPEHDDKYGLHRLLSVLFSMELSVDEKLGIVETEYGIPLNDNMREDVITMCNLSQGIREKGRAEGEAKGRAEGEAKGRAEGEAKGRAEGEAKGRAEGEAKGRAEGEARSEVRFILNMHRNNFTLEQIALAAGKSVEEVERVIQDKDSVLI